MALNKTQFVNRKCKRLDGELLTMTSVGVKIWPITAYEAIMMKDELGALDVKYNHADSVGFFTLTETLTRKVRENVRN